MSVTFNADEIFEMAEEIERKGAAFYREASEKTRDDAIKKMMLDMAKMEDNHLAIFEEMRKDLTEAEREQTTFDPQNEAAMYLRTYADARGYEGKIAPDKKLTGSESMEDLIHIALNAEKNSVAFYVGIKELVPKDIGKEKVQKIIKEEMSHIATLNEKLAELTQ